MTEVSAAQTNKNNGTAESPCPTDTKRAFTVGAAISRPMGGSFVIGGRGRLRAPPVADTASKKEWQNQGDWRACFARDDRAADSTEHAPALQGLYTIQYSTFYRRSLLRKYEKEKRTGENLRCVLCNLPSAYAVGWLASSMILTNFAGTRLAPPIRPPSMSGCASSS